MRDDELTSRCLFCSLARRLHLPEAEKQERQVGSAAPARVDNLANSVATGSDLLDINRQDTEENNLNGGTRSIPEGTRNTVLPRHVGRLKKGGSPSPLRDDHRGSKTRLDHAPSSAVSVRRKSSVIRVSMMILYNYNNILSWYKQATIRLQY